MTSADRPGWVHIKGERTAYTNYYKKLKDDEADAWPPRHWRFLLATDGSPAVEAAFTDPRRFGRVRLVDCPGDAIRSHSPLKENGPDPVVDAALFTEGYLASRARARRVPVKALLLDQTVLSGVGNWVADEALFHARLHPEQPCGDMTEAQVRRLWEAVRDVCATAVGKLGDSDQFPDGWLFNHRWGKGKGKAPALPSGEELAFITVGGRTSCYAPALQKKTGRAALAEAPVEEKRKVTSTSEESEESEGEGAKRKRKRAKDDGSRKKVAVSRVKEENDGEDEGNGPVKVETDDEQPGRITRSRRLKGDAEDKMKARRKPAVEAQDRPRRGRRRIT